MQRAPPPEHSISPSSRDMFSPSPTHCWLTAQNIVWLPEKNTWTSVSPAFSFFSPDFFGQQQNIPCWRHCRCQPWLWGNEPKQTNATHTTAAPAAICKLLQCCNTRPLLSFKFCCRALAARHIFFLWNLRCCKAVRGFCQSFPFISLLRPPASHNTTALMLKLPQLNWLLLPALQRTGKCRDGMRRKRLFLCWVSFLCFVSFPLGKVAEVMIIRCVLAKARNPRNPVPYPFHAVNHWPWVENNLLMP